MLCIFLGEKGCNSSNKGPPARFAVVSPWVEFRRILGDGVSSLYETRDRIGGE